jgi:hypothetical protein
MPVKLFFFLTGKKIWKLYHNLWFISYKFIKSKDFINNRLFDQKLLNNIEDLNKWIKA